MTKIAISNKPITVTIATVRTLTGLGPTTIWQLIKDGHLGGNSNRQAHPREIRFP